MAALLLFLSALSTYVFAATHAAPSIDPEVYMDVTQLITSKGYPCENHYVTTSDGFILNLQRIPHGLKPGPGNVTAKPVVILWHGLEMTSSVFVDNLANESLAFILADVGADVWLGNSRGNTYSANHTTLKKNTKEFWYWSWDEMAALDMPAALDYVTDHAGVKQVHWVGHSQGTMIGFAGFSSNHTMAAMIKRFYALAPVTKVRHITSPVKLLAPLGKQLLAAYELLGRYDFWSYNKEIMDFLAKDICRDRAGDVLCENVLFLLGGWDRTHLNESRIPVYIAQNPGGTSVQNILHFAQGCNVDTFAKFDYGSVKENIAHYNQPEPPQYNLSAFNVPVVFYTGGHDIMANPTDVAWLKEQIKPALIDDVNVPDWEHFDFAWAKNAPKLCYLDMLARIFGK